MPNGTTAYGKHSQAEFLLFLRVICWISAEVVIHHNYTCSYTSLSNATTQ